MSLHNMGCKSLVLSIKSITLKKKSICQIVIFEFTVWMYIYKKVKYDNLEFFDHFHYLNHLTRRMWSPDNQKGNTLSR